jgi:hypothetical protein
LSARTRDWARATLRFAVAEPGWLRSRAFALRRAAVSRLNCFLLVLTCDSARAHFDAPMAVADAAVATSVAARAATSSECEIVLLTEASRWS